MTRGRRGVVAAGHPLSARAGAAALEAGGNAVDAALAAMLMSCVCEPLLTGLGAGGYMLVVPPGRSDPVLLDFFVEAPGRGGVERSADLIPVEVSFGDAVQVFHVGAASVGVYGLPSGIATAARRFGRLALSDLTAPAAAAARAGVPLNDQQAYIVQILGDILRSSPEAAEVWLREEAVLTSGDSFTSAELANSLELLGEEGDEPFYRGWIAERSADWVAERGGTLSREDLAAYETRAREPIRVAYRDRTVVTNPPPNAGGLLLAYSLGLLHRGPSPPDTRRFVDALRTANAERTDAWVEGLPAAEFAARFLASRLGSTTHISVMDDEGWACAVTSSNGEGSGLIVPGTGLHLNNMLGEEDLNPLGFHRHQPGRRLPSGMAPTAVLRDGQVEMVIGSAGSNRIRSAILQTIIGVVDRGEDVRTAIEAPRLHFEDGHLYAEPGASTAGLGLPELEVSHFGAPNVFFGGVQAVLRDQGTGEMTGGGDPRRGGAVEAV